MDIGTITYILCTHGHVHVHACISKWHFQVSAGEDSKLFEGLQKLVSDDGETDQQLQLQCCLRLLFSQYTEWVIHCVSVIEISGTCVHESNKPMQFPFRFPEGANTSCHTHVHVISWRCMLIWYISVCRLCVWSFSQLTRMIIAQSQHSDGQSTFIQSSSPLHDLLATPISTTVSATPNKSRSFQVCACMQYSRPTCLASQTDSYTTFVSYAYIV